MSMASRLSLSLCVSTRHLVRSSAHCVYETSRQTLSLYLSRGLQPLAQIDCVYEASKQILTFCLTIRLV